MAIAEAPHQLELDLRDDHPRSFHGSAAKELWSPAFFFAAAKRGKGWKTVQVGKIVAEGATHLSLFPQTSVTISRRGSRIEEARLALRRDWLRVGIAITAASRKFVQEHQSARRTDPTTR